MNFNIPLLKTIRILLFPFSLIYGLVIWLRNKLYDKGIIKSETFNFPIVCVGNISAGGTGKSPMVEYLISQLQHDFHVAALSRGYKRKTEGYIVANSDSTAFDIGDEPMHFYIRFPGITVAVGEKRIEAIPQILQDKPNTNVIILDDAFQHRAVKAGLNIVLTDYNNLYYHDWYLPSGDLRDSVSSLKRADVIVVTKCPQAVSQEKKDEIIQEIDPACYQKIFFSSIHYGLPYHITEKNECRLDEDLEVLLVTGIANPKPLKKLLEEKCKAYYQLSFSNHHFFTLEDMFSIEKQFISINADKKIILTTEKDAVRLSKFSRQLKNLPLYVIPIDIEILFNKQDEFNDLVKTFILEFDKNKEGKPHLKTKFNSTPVTQKLYEEILEINKPIDQIVSTIDSADVVEAVFHKVEEEYPTTLAEAEFPAFKEEEKNIEDQVEKNEKLMPDKKESEEVIADPAMQVELSAIEEENIDETEASPIYMAAVPHKPMEFTGYIGEHGNFTFFIAEFKKSMPDIYIPQEKLNNANKNDKVLVRITKWEENKIAIGEVIKIIHKKDAGENEMVMSEVAILKDGVLVGFEDEIQRAIAGIPEKKCVQEQENPISFEKKMEEKCKSCHEKQRAEELAKQVQDFEEMLTLSIKVKERSSKKSSKKKKDKQEKKKKEKVSAKEKKGKKKKKKKH